LTETIAKTQVHHRFFDG